MVKHDLASKDDDMVDDWFLGCLTALI